MKWKWFDVSNSFATKAVFAITVICIVWLMMSCSGCASSHVKVTEEPVNVEPTPTEEPTEVIDVESLEAKFLEPIEEPVEEPVEVPSDTTMIQ